MYGTIFVKTKSIQLSLNNFKYKKDYFKDLRCYWKCVTPDCRSRTISSSIVPGNDQVEIIKFSEHNHGPPSEMPEWEVQLYQILKTHEMVKPQIIINKLHGRCEIIPSEIMLRNRIAYYRKKNGVQSITLNQNLVENNILSNNSENFVLFDNFQHERNGRIIIFGNDENVRRLARFKMWMCDGTFSICPAEFHQLFTIFAKVYNIWLPMLYCLMEHRTVQDYDEIFEFVGQSVNNEPPTVIMDFEQASTSSFRNVFVDGTVLHCFFHLSQSVFRKVQSLGLSALYTNEEDDLKDKIRKLLSVAFLPEESVKVSLLEMMDNEEDADVKSIMEYFNDTYVSGKFIKLARRKEIRAQPLYPIAEWNVHSRFEEDIERTTNCQESFHNHLRIVCIHDHLQMHRLIYVLMEENE